MAKYSNIKGFTVQTVSSDPVASAVAGGAWASGGNLPSVLYENAGAGATQSASMNFGGQGNSPSPQFPHTADTQTYDGSSWTEVNNLNNSRRFLSGAGVITSALGYGGYTVPPSAPGTKDLCESWDGTNWTEVAELNTKRREVAGIGTSNSNALCVQGTDGTSVTSEVESWNGSSWTEVAEANTLRFRSANTGSNTASIIVGGEVPSTADSALVESWNGSAWTEIADINTARQQFSGAGTYTDALVMGGSPDIAKTEYYNGSSWSEQADLSLGRYINYGSSGDTVAQGMVFGGNAPAPAGHRTNSTEEWSQPSVFSKQLEGQLFFNSTANAFKETILDVPAGTWASGTSFPQAVTEKGGAASSNSNGVFGAESPVAATFEYDGTSWTAGGTQNTSRQSNYFGTGSSTAAIFAGGSVPPSRTANAETYNGSSFTEVGDLNSARSVLAAGPAGTQTSAIAGTGGTGPGPNDGSVLSESWNGSAWTETADLSTSRRLAGQMGASNTSSLIVGGALTSPGARTANTEVWNGSSWTEVNNLNSARNNLAGAGNVSVGIAFAGNENSPPYSAKTEAWNGTSWSEVNDMSSPRQYVKGGGTASSAIVLGGYIEGPGASSALTEEWTADLANKTITAS